MKKASITIKDTSKENFNKRSTSSKDFRNCFSKKMYDLLSQLTTHKPSKKGSGDLRQLTMRFKKKMRKQKLMRTNWRQNWERRRSS